MRRWIMLAAALVALGGQAQADELISVKSAKPVGETIDRLQGVVQGEGFFVVGRVPHSEAAKGVGLTLRPTELLIFGKPQSGTPVMVCDQRAGIDLPLRAVSWQDADGQVWLAMLDPQVLKARYGLAPACDAPLAMMGAAVRKLLAAATAP